jgi:acetyl esterase/lipase
MLAMTEIRESGTTYEAADSRKLPLLVFEPARDTELTAGVVLFHGGGLHKGSADELAPHCRELASSGLLAVSAAYRLLGQGAGSIDDCLADVVLAIERFRVLAAARHLGASRLASGGSSAGAHLALVAAMTGPHQTASVPAEPGIAAIVALNPPVDLLAYPPEGQRLLEKDAGIAAGRLADYSPAELVRPGQPSVLIQHGTHDAIAPVDQARRFRKLMAQAGNDCVLHEYEGAEHAFHYPGDGYFDTVMAISTAFLLERLTLG